MVPDSVASRSSYCLLTIPEVGECHVADVGSVGDFGEYGTLGSFEPKESPGTGTSGQPVLHADLVTLGQLKTGLAAKKRKWNGVVFVTRVQDIQIRFQQGSQKNLVGF